MYLYKNKKINIEAPLTLDGIQYPAGFFKDKAARDARGITEMPDPVRPDERFFFIQENDDGTLAVNPKDRSAVNNMVWGWIKTHRDNLTNNGGYKVTVDGVDKWFHSDVFSRSQQISLVLLGNNIPAGLQWKTMDGSFVTMTPTLAQQIFAAGAASDAAIFAAAIAHKAGVEATDTPETYDWTTGWPKVFGE